MCDRDEFCICMRRKRRKDLGQESRASSPRVSTDLHKRESTCTGA